MVVPFYEWPCFTATTRIDPKFGMYLIWTEKNHKPRSNRKNNRGLFGANPSCLGLRVNAKESPAYQKKRTPQCSSSAGGYSLTPKLKSETTRLCVAVLTIKQELAGSSAHIPYGEGGVRCEAAPCKRRKFVHGFLEIWPHSATAVLC